MIGFEDLLATCVREPLNTNARGVLADWLEEHGDNRSKWLRECKVLFKFGKNGQQYWGASANFPQKKEGKNQKWSTCKPWRISQRRASLELVWEMCDVLGFYPCIFCRPWSRITPAPCLQCNLTSLIPNKTYITPTFKNQQLR